VLVLVLVIDFSPSIGAENDCHPPPNRKIENENDDEYEHD
jgi:hypothetical protein